MDSPVPARHAADQLTGSSSTDLPGHNPPTDRSPFVRLTASGHTLPALVVEWLKFAPLF